MCRANGRRCPNCYDNKRDLSRRKANRMYKKSLVEHARQIGGSELAEAVKSAPFSAMYGITQKLGLDPANFTAIRPVAPRTHDASAALAEFDSVAGKYTDPDAYLKHLKENPDEAHSAAGEHLHRISLAAGKDLTGEAEQAFGKESSFVTTMLMAEEQDRRDEQELRENPNYAPPRKSVEEQIADQENLDYLRRKLEGKATSEDDARYERDLQSLRDRLAEDAPEGYDYSPDEDAAAMEERDDRIANEEQLAKLREALSDGETSTDPNAWDGNSWCNDCGHDCVGPAESASSVGCQCTSVGGCPDCGCDEGERSRRIEEAEAASFFEYQVDKQADEMRQLREITQTREQAARFEGLEAGDPVAWVQPDGSVIQPDGNSRIHPLSEPLYASDQLRSLSVPVKDGPVRGYLLADGQIAPSSGDAPIGAIPLRESGEQITEENYSTSAAAPAAVVTEESITGIDAQIDSDQRAHRARLLSVVPVIPSSLGEKTPKPDPSITKDMTRAEAEALRDTWKARVTAADVIGNDPAPTESDYMEAEAIQKRIQDNHVDVMLARVDQETERMGVNATELFVMREELSEKLTRTGKAMGGVDFISGNGEPAGVLTKDIKVVADKLSRITGEKLDPADMRGETGRKYIAALARIGRADIPEQAVPAAVWEGYVKRAKGDTDKARGALTDDIIKMTRNKDSVLDFASRFPDRERISMLDQVDTTIGRFSHDPREDWAESEKLRAQLTDVAGRVRISGDLIPPRSSVAPSPWKVHSTETVTGDYEIEETVAYTINRSVQSLLDERQSSDSSRLLAREILDQAAEARKMPTDSLHSRSERLWRLIELADVAEQNLTTTDVADLVLDIEPEIDPAQINLFSNKV